VHQLHEAPLRDRALLLVPQVDGVPHLGVDGPVLMHLAGLRTAMIGNCGGPRSGKSGGSRPLSSCGGPARANARRVMTRWEGGCISQCPRRAQCEDGSVQMVAVRGRIEGRRL